MKVAFLGLGIMGARMAHNLRAQGVELTVYNRTASATEALAAAGATVADTPQQAVKGADIVWTMLSKPEVVSSVAWGEAGFLSAMQPDALWVDSSTVNPAFVTEADAAAQAAGVRYLEAPVAGSKPQAEAAALVFFVGGEAADVAQAEPFMQHMGQKVLHLGPTGKAASFKILVNAMLAQSMIVFSEAVLLGQKLGLDRNFLLNTLPGLVVAAPFTKAKAEMIRAEDYAVQFPLELMYKDLHLAALTAYEQEQPSFLLNAAKEIYAAATQSGLGRADFSAIHQWLEGK